MLTHAEINARFVALDRDQRLMTETFDGWLAWPIVKERLWLACLQAASGEAVRRHSIACRLWRVAAGIVEIVKHVAVPQRGQQGLLYEPRRTILPDGRVIHPHLGSRPYDGQPSFRCVYGPEGGVGDRQAVPDHEVGAVLALLAGLVRRTTSIRQVAKRLRDAVADACPELPRQALGTIIADQLARFRLRTALFRHLLRRAGVRSVVVLDPDSKVAEVAAARSLNIPVIEVQHGMFSAQEPDYSWSATHRTLSVPLPLPDRIVVFGALWRDEILRAGYWRPDEVVQVKNPLIEAYRLARRERNRCTKDAGIRVLFASQGYVRPAALPFWKEVLTRCRNQSDLRLDLRIKVHSLEESFRGEYEALARQFPGSCTVVPPSVDAFEELIRADLMVGYTSLMMLEATGIGVPAIGLRGGAAAEGFAATFGLTMAATGIEECASPSCFLRRLQDWRQNSQRAAVGDGHVVRSVYDHDGLDLETALSTF